MPISIELPPEPEQQQNEAVEELPTMNTHIYCQLFMNEALLSEHGMMEKFETKKAAVSFRIKCYQARAKVLRMNTRVGKATEKHHLELESTAWYTTPWDHMEFFLKEIPEGWGILAMNGAGLLQRLVIGRVRLTAEDVLNLFKDKKGTQSGK